AGNVDPVLASPRILTGFDDKGAPQLRPAREHLTLRNLLTHTSGFSYPLWDPAGLRYLRFVRGRNDKDLPRMPLMFEPGAKWAYG
ncbi:serine hydrolase, partial [Acinetobacter baumannii]